VRFRDFISIRRFLAPRWQTEGDGEGIAFALGAVENGFAESLRLGILARLPQNDPTGLTTAPDDALQAMGRDRKILQGIEETAVSYAARLLVWLDDHRARGTAFMMMKQLAGYLGAGFSFRIYDVAGNCYSRDVNGVQTYVAATTWDWDGGSDRWARFWVVVYPTGDWTESTLDWGDTSPKYGRNLAQWGVDIPREQIAGMRSIVTDWKPEGTRCVNIIVAFDPASFNPSAPEPDGTWRFAYKKSAGTVVNSRLTTARYLRGSDAA
jgi:hypothetical protein